MHQAFFFLEPQIAQTMWFRPSVGLSECGFLLMLGGRFLGDDATCNRPVKNGDGAATKCDWRLAFEGRPNAREEGRWGGRRKVDRDENRTAPTPNCRPACGHPIVFFYKKLHFGKFPRRRIGPAILAAPKKNIPAPPARRNSARRFVARLTWDVAPHGRWPRGIFIGYYYRYGYIGFRAAGPESVLLTLGARRGGQVTFSACMGSAPHDPSPTQRSAVDAGVSCICRLPPLRRQRIRQGVLPKTAAGVAAQPGISSASASNAAKIAVPSEREHFLRPPVRAAAVHGLRTGGFSARQDCSRPICPRSKI